MIEHRLFNQLAGEARGWQRAIPAFSLAAYYDVTPMGWGSLRVWNGDEMAQRGLSAPSRRHGNHHLCPCGLPTHTHSLDNEGRTEAGDAQGKSPLPHSPAPSIGSRRMRISQGFGR
jgi:quercetin 2,3-dioxygenase